MSDGLRAKIELGLPRELPVGAGTTLFAYGWCWHPDAAVASLELDVGGRRTEVEELGMPRRDVYAAAQRARIRELDPEGDWMQPDAAGGSPGTARADSPGYRSGFWAFVDIPAVGARERVEVGIRARLEDGREAAAAAGAMTLVPGLEREPATVPAASGAADGPLLTICMATFNPDLERFRGQVRSIQEQTYRRWVCVISDDDSREDVRREIAGLIAADPRFVLRPSSRRLGFYRNFERALAAVPEEAELVALSDQDDRWYPEKLETLIGALGDHQLAFSDMRITDESGAVLSGSYWDHRPNNTTEIDRLLLINTVTGAASIFRRELLDLVLPFPARIGPRAYHDQWIAAVALATGTLGYVPEPLYDYVQHGSSVLGHPAATEAEEPGLRERGLRLAFGQRDLYFGDYCRLQVAARTLLLRCGSRADPEKLARLRGLLRLDTATGVARLAARSLRPRHRSPSFGEERKLLRALAWPSVVRAVSRTGRGRRSYDAAIPDGVRDAIEPQVEEAPGIRDLREMTEPLALRVVDGEPARLNVLIPGVDLRRFFGGYIGIFNLALRLARDRRVRIVSFERDLDHLPANWRAQVERFSGLAGFFDAVELTATPGGALDVSPEDRFMATTWWSAHKAAAAARELKRNRFLYLVQDYEPLFYPMGTWNALAEQSYSFPHFALFSTDLLREFFAQRRLGVFADGDEAGRSESAAFSNAITPAAPPAAEDMARRERRRLLFYARLESYSPRNLFDLGLLALGDLIAEGTIDDRWDLYGIGSVGGPARFELPGGHDLQITPRQAEGSYADFLSRHDIGVSLMHSPHPSLVPIEMASAGMVTVTNSYANKTAEEMARISPNLIAGEPTREGIAEALRRACAAVDDFEARIAGAAVRWPTDWDSALDEALLARLGELLDAC